MPNAGPLSQDKLKSDHGGQSSYFEEQNNDCRLEMSIADKVPPSEETRAMPLLRVNAVPWASQQKHCEKFVERYAKNRQINRFS